MNDDIFRLLESLDLKPEDIRLLRNGKEENIGSMLKILKLALIGVLFRDYILGHGTYAGFALDILTDNYDDYKGAAEAVFYE